MLRPLLAAHFGAVLRRHNACYGAARIDSNSPRPKRIKPSCARSGSNLAHRGPSSEAQLANLHGTFEQLTAIGSQF